MHDWSSSDRLQYNSRDIRGLIDDIFDYVAMAFRVPVRLLRGDVAELGHSVDALIMFAIKPLAELIADEINAKLYTKRQYLNRTYMKINTNRIKLVNIAQYANAADRLFAAGVNTINDNLRMFDREPVSEPWGDMRFVTKNYSRVETLVEGGENNDEEPDDGNAED